MDGNVISLDEKIALLDEKVTILDEKIALSDNQRTLLSVHTISQYDNFHKIWK